MNDIFSRVDSVLTLPQVLELVRKEYQFSTIKTSVPILTGYQDCNIDVTCENGRFVIKIFSSEKTKKRIGDVIDGYAKLHKAGIPVPTLIKTTSGAYLLEIAGKTHPSYLCVFEYFAGKNLTQVPVTDTDLETLTQYITTLHNMTRKIEPYYDTLAIPNLSAEYAQKKDMLFPDEQSKLDPIITELRRVKLAAMRQSVTHGALEKENMLKNSNNALCILDLGCINYQASILDLATYISNFTLYLTEERRKRVTSIILDTYQKSFPLTKLEMTALPILIRAQYASYIIGMTYHMRKDHDMSKQTQTWLDRGWDGLRTYKVLKKLI